MATEVRALALPDVAAWATAVLAPWLLGRGMLLLVANRHLAYEETLAARFAAVRSVVERDGFKVIEAKEPRA